LQKLHNSTPVLSKSKVVAALLCASAYFCFPADSSAGTTEGQVKKAGTAHKAHKAHPKPAKSHKHSHSRKARKLVVTQESDGHVVLRDLEAAKLPVYGPFLPAELEEASEPICEPIDTLLEARVHEPDAETPEATGADLGGELVEKAAASGPGLELIASQLKS